MVDQYEPAMCFDHMANWEDEGENGIGLSSCARGIALCGIHYSKTE